MRQTSSITFWFSTVLRRACPSFSHAPREPCSPTPDQDHVRGQRPLEAPAFSDSWHDLADVHVYTCEYIYTLYIHSTIIHMHIYIPTVSPVFWNKIIVTSKPKTIYCAGQHGVPLWWKWPWFLVRCHTFLWNIWEPVGWANNVQLHWSSFIQSP